MKIDEKKIRGIIQKVIRKGINETDLVAPNKASWETKKVEFKNLTSNLLKNIESDDYDDASGEITKTITILKTWKNRIDKNISDSKFNENVSHVEDSLMDVKKLITHNIDQEFQEYILPSTAKYTYGPDDDGTYHAEVKLAIPSHYFSTLTDAERETSKQLSFNHYSGPGQSYSKGNITADKEVKDGQKSYYVLTFNLEGGYDI